MKSEVISHKVLSQFESKIQGSFQTNSGALQTLCPVSEAICYKVTFIKENVKQIFLCWADNLIPYTNDQTFRLSDTNQEVLTEDRVTYWLDKSLNLSDSDEWAPVFISSDLSSAALVAIDGNHRLMAHYVTHGSVEGVHAYLFVHPSAKNWKWFPDHARELFFQK